MDREDIILHRSLFEDVLINVIPFFGPILTKRFPGIQYGILILIYGSLMTIFMFITGFSLHIGLLLGTTILGILLWSLSFNRIAEGYRDLVCPEDLISGIKIYKKYYNALTSNHSLIYSTVFSLIGISYFYSSNLMKTSLLVFNLSLESTLIEKTAFFFLAFLLTFDISFRAVTSGNALISMFYRNYLFSNYLRTNREDLRILPYVAITTRFDRSIFLSFFIFLFWFPIPLLLGDSILISLFLITFMISGFSVIINSIWIRRIRATTIPGIVHIALSQKYHCFFASVTSSNKPHVTPILFGFDGVNLYFNTSIAAKKIRNLQHQNRVTILLNTIDNSQKIVFYGKTLVYGHNTFWTILYFFIYWPELLYAYKMLQRKYKEVLEYYRNINLPLVWSPKPFIARTMIKIIPEKIVIK